METKKEQIISAFTESLNKHCETDQDLTNLIEALEKFNLFINEQHQKNNPDLFLDLMTIKSILTDSCGDSNLLDIQYLMTDEYFASTLIAEKYAKESGLLFEIISDLNS